MVASLSTGLWRLNDRNELDVHLHHGQARALQSTARFVTILADALRYIGAHLNANDGPSRIDPIGLDA